MLKLLGGDSFRPAEWGEHATSQGHEGLAAVWLSIVLGLVVFWTTVGVLRLAVGE